MSTAPLELWPPQFEAAIFDFDGTLSDTAALWHEVDRAFLSARGIAYTEGYSQRLAPLGFRAGALYTIETYDLPESVDEVCMEWSRMGRALFETRATLRPGVERYIAALRQQGIPTALATINSREMLDSMRKADLGPLFDVRVHGEDVARSKEHPDIYLETARQLEISPDSCIVFEDIEAALKSARSIGMLGCGVRANDPTQRVELVRDAADLWLDDWEDINLTS